jgi:hypothetical protein
MIFSGGGVQLYTTFISRGFLRGDRLHHISAPLHRMAKRMSLLGAVLESSCKVPPYVVGTVLRLM